MMTINKISSNSQEYIHHDEEHSNEREGNHPQEAQSSKSKKKVYQRHTPQQIYRLEQVFQICPQPEEQDRKKLGQELGMSSLRVKFWFQNRRTQTKNKSNKLQNVQLKLENERIRGENVTLTRRLQAITCSRCSFKADQGVTEDAIALSSMNAQLREKINEYKKLIGEYCLVAPSSAPNVQPIPEIPLRGTTLGVDLQAATNLAEAASGELLAMAMVKDPLWWPIGPDGTEILNEQEYYESFNGGNIGPRPLGYFTEATRAAAMIPTNLYALIEVFMDATKWAAFFFDIVSRAMTMEVLFRGRGLSDGRMEVISAEFQLPTPLVPLRESCFLRYCKKVSEDRTWIIVDVSMDSLLQPESIPNCRRRPSGCVIQEMSNNFLKITWVEHVEVDYRSTNEMYKTMVSCGMAFGARRCLAILDRQCERIRSVTSNNNIRILAPQIETNIVLRLAERMTRSFNCSASGNPRKSWIPIPRNGDDNVQIVGRVNVDDPAKPIGVIFCASTSFRMPFLPKRIFDFLINDSMRLTWNILYVGGTFLKIAEIPIGKEASNRVSIYYVNGVQSSHNIDRDSMFLQESCSDETGSYVIYAPVSTASMNSLATEGDPDKIPLLASGFSVFPDGPREHTGGSLVTIAFQIHVDSNPMLVEVSPQVVTAVTNLVKATQYKIMRALLTQFP